jgi:hypothetical protein
MPEFILTPEKKALPSAPSLLNQIHEMGFPVEINVKGKPENWEDLRFHEAGPPEVECLVSYDGRQGRYSLQVSSDAPPKAYDLQLALVELLLKNLGGQVDNRVTRERFTAAEFVRKMTHHRISQSNPWDSYWLAFSWVVVFFGLFLSFTLHPGLKGVILSIVVLALVSAVGLTYTRFKNK